MQAPRGLRAGAPALAGAGSAAAVPPRTAVGSGVVAGRRLASLDVLRGLTLIGMMLVNYAAALKDLGCRVFPQLLHAAWAGFHFADSVFPAFVLMTGVAIPFAGRPQVPGRKALLEVSARTLRLIGIGVVVSNLGWLSSFGDGLFRPEGVLQRIALAYFGAALLYQRCGGRTRLLVAAGLLLGYWGLCCLPLPDGGKTNLLLPGANFSSWVDRALLGRHIYVTGPLGFDPEGLLGTLPAVAQALIGVAAGEWIQARRNPAVLAAAGVALVLGALAWEPLFPVVKALWSSSFVLLSSGVTLVVLAALHAAMDLGGWGARATRPAADFGVNSIIAYCMHEALAPLLGLPVLKLLYVDTAPVLGKPLAAILPSLAVILPIWLVLRLMRARGWIIRV